MNNIYIAILSELTVMREEWDNTRVLCAALMKSRCEKYAKKICIDKKIDSKLIEIKEIPFDNIMGYHDVDKFYSE